MVEASATALSGRREPFVLEEENIGEYRYFGIDKVGRLLTELGYGDSKKLVDALYVHEDGLRAVGVLRVTDEMCEGHFGGVMRGVDQVEAAGQVILLLQEVSGRLPDTYVPRLTVSEASYIGAAVSGMVLNITVISEPNLPIGGSAWISNGTAQIAVAFLQGVVMEGKVSDRLLRRAARSIQEPIFPLR